MKTARRAARRRAARAVPRVAALATRASGGCAPRRVRGTRGEPALDFQRGAARRPAIDTLLDGRATRFSKTKREALLVGSASLLPRDSTHLQQRNRLLHLRLFFALALEHRGTFGQSSAGGHSGAPASARERAIRQQKKTNDSGSRLGCVGVAGGASGGPPTHHVRCRLGKKKHVVYETHSTRASSAKRLKSKTQRVHACSLWILSPSRARRQNFAAANHGVRVRRFTLARSRPRGSALPSVDCPRRSGGGHFGARTRR